MFEDDYDLGHATFQITSSSSVMALVRAVAGHVMRSNAVPADLIRSFMSLKIVWFFSATVPHSETGWRWLAISIASCGFVNDSNYDSGKCETPSRSQLRNPSAVKVSCGRNLVE
jgi:hypothetical protein